METQTYTISYDSLEFLTKKINSFKKKVDKYGKSLNISVSEPYMKEIQKIVTDGRSSCSYPIFIKAIDVTMNYDLIINEGWEVLAQLEKTESGNLIYNFSGKDLSKFSLHGDTELKCQHCNTKHNRKKVYLVQKKRIVKMVGSSCLKEYTGIDPSMVLLFNSLKDIFEDLNEYVSGEVREYRGTEYFETSQILTYAISIFEKNGWNSVDSQNSNRNELYKASQLKIQSTKEAEEMIEFFKDREVKSEFEYNIKVITQNKFCSKNQFGFIAYIPVLYKRLNEKKKEEVESTSEYVGKKGQTIEFKVDSYHVVTSFQSDFGWVDVIRMTDEKGNVFTWFKTGMIQIEIGQICRAKVKNHQEFNGVKQTILTRCRIKGEKK